ncbi:MAG: WYL domain-containing protein [Ilumatobacter sp.]|uniref:helix-turn-helix transcriptional regulator n=1 Tax=Ilumatobacter sp. TaxID=1967498 RepID=UPI0032991324
MADRVERLTNLLAVLLETKVPMSLADITDALSGQYPDVERPRRQAFERDKLALREIGVPIEMEVRVGDEFAGQTMYWIDRSAYELDDLDLEPDEMRALQVAVATVRTDSQVGADAILKLGGGAGLAERPSVSAVLPDRPELPVIRAAVAARAPLTFEYRGEERTVEPWGVLLRGGFWYLVGHDRLRRAKRTFRVDRIDGELDVGEGDAFERPPDFDPRTAFPADPKQIGHASDDAVDATVHIAALRARAIERELGAHRVVDRRDDGSIDVSVPATNLDAFRSWVIGLVDHAEVLGPPEVRAHVVDWLRAVSEPGGAEADHLAEHIR